MKTKKTIYFANTGQCDTHMPNVKTFDRLKDAMEYVKGMAHAYILARDYNGDIELASRLAYVSNNDVQRYAFSLHGLLHKDERRECKEELMKAISGLIEHGMGIYADIIAKVPMGRKLKRMLGTWPYFEARTGRLGEEEYNAW